MAGKKVSTAEETVSNFRRKTGKKFSGEEKIRIVLEGLRGEQSVAELLISAPGKVPGWGYALEIHL